MKRVSSAPGPEIEDSELIQCCLAGDERAWSVLVDRYQRLVFSVALRTGLSADDADDVFQMVFTTLFRRLDGLRDQSRLASWLITTTHRESWRLTKAKRGRVELDEAVVDPGAPPPDLAEEADRDQRVREAMARLDERCRMLLTSLFLDPGTPSYGEIAARIGMPVGSIGPTRARCFKKLESLLFEAGLGKSGEDAG
jgi:RNA polymerase sigma factor (sigma-70 family)